jgi:HEAT repeat protein
LPVAILATQDEDAKVRLNAVQTLWEYEENICELIFLDLVRSDPNYEVRTAAALGLGRYVFLGEIEELPKERLQEIEDVLLANVNSRKPDILRRAALEALGFSSRLEVPPLIENAYESADKHWQASALKAMGRSCNEDWKSKVLAMIDHTMPVVRAEAARAAGELEIEEARLPLIEMLDDPDDNTRYASIWALSQIGDADVQVILEDLMMESEDDNEIEFIENAIDNLVFNQSLMMPLFDIQDEDIDTLGLDFDQDSDLTDDLYEE